MELSRLEIETDHRQMEESVTSWRVIVTTPLALHLATPPIPPIPHLESPSPLSPRATDVTLPSPFSFSPSSTINIVLC